MLYIDSCTIIAHWSELKDIKHLITSSFPIKDLSKAMSVLRIEISQDHPTSKLYIRQKGKIENILTTFRLSNCKHVLMLMVLNLQLPTNAKTCDDFEYHSAISMLSYLAHATQPDILFTMAYLSHFTNNFNNKHVVTIKHILHYLTSMADLAICYTCDLYNNKDATMHIPIRYCNMDWGNINLNHHLISGFIFLYCGGVVSWSIKTQMCHTLIHQS